VTFLLDPCLLSTYKMVQNAVQNVHSCPLFRDTLFSCSLKMYASLSFTKGLFLLLLRKEKSCAATAAAATNFTCSKPTARNHGVAAATEEVMRLVNGGKNGNNLTWQCREFMAKAMCSRFLAVPEVAPPTQA
jgi:hypothetical protein